MKRVISATVLAVMLAGCSIIPKTVEFGQDKVQKFPVAKSAEKEVQRQTAQRAAQKSEETLRAALEVEAGPAVVQPAKEASVLSDSVAGSLGPPLSPADPELPSEKLAKKLDTAVAKLNHRIDNFKEDNNENAGKKIEDTGFLKIPYFVYLGGVFVFLIIAYLIFKVGSVALKAYSLSNPPVAVGLKAVQAGGALGAKAVGQLIAGGERFKDSLKTKLPEVDAATTAKVQQLFIDAHKTAQDEDVQSLVKHLAS